jgi:hypothetical protein
MFLRSVPLIICLLWLGYEARFSPSFFVATLETSLTSISSGIEDAISGDVPAPTATKMASAEEK